MCGCVMTPEEIADDIRQASARLLLSRFGMFTYDPPTPEQARWCAWADEWRRLH